MRTPLSEVLKYLELDQKEQADKRMDEYMMLVHADPNVEQKYRKLYVDAITPQHARPKLKLETDLDQLRRLKANQSNGGIE